MTAPLVLQISSNPSFTVGEGPVISIQHTVLAGLDMETVELNHERTKIFLTRIESRPEGEHRDERVLTGEDHARWHRVSLLGEIGTRFRASAGDVWVSPLELLKYGPALPRGKYTLSLEYRYGDDWVDSVRSNQIAFDVIPIDLAGARFRWFGESDPRGELAAARLGVDGDREAWFFQTSSPRHPEVLRTSANLASGDWTMIEAPRLCHLNDIHAFHFARRMVWLSPGALSVLPVHVGGRQGDPRSFSHGLADDPAPTLVDPPLQLRAGGEAAVLVGHAANGAPVAALLEIDGAGVARIAHAAMPPTAQRHRAVAWGSTEEPPSARLFYTEPSSSPSPAPPHTALRSIDLRTERHSELGAMVGDVEGLVIDQWLGNGAVLVLCADASRRKRTLYRYEFDENGGSFAERDWAPLSGDLPSQPPLQLVPLADRADVAALFATGDSWIVATSHGFWRAPLAHSRGAPPALVANAKGILFFVLWDRDLGFIAEALELRPYSTAS